jgi:hypothetical protein
MKLLVQPDDGIAPLLKAIRGAKTSVHIVVFRFDLPDLEEALARPLREACRCMRSSPTRTEGERSGCASSSSVSSTPASPSPRTADDLSRYHGKVMVADKTLFVLGFNYTRLDIERSRSFGVVAADGRLVKAAVDLIESDANRQPYTPSDDRLVVSPRMRGKCSRSSSAAPRRRSASTR